MSIVERKASPKMGDEFAMEYSIYIYIERERESKSQNLEKIQLNFN